MDFIYPLFLKAIVGINTGKTRGFPCSQKQREYFYYLVTLAEYAKNNKLSHSNLLNKANRQTIEAFLERGVWKIGIEAKGVAKRKRNNKSKALYRQRI